MQLNSKTIIGLALALVSVSSFAQQKSLYTPKRGVQEFSGRMVVRPLQLDAMISRGFTGTQIDTLRKSVSDSLRPNLIRYVRATDEYIVRVPKGSNENDFGAQLIATGNYQYVVPDWLCYPVMDSNDPRLSQQWHHRVMQTKQAWNLWTGAPNFTTAFVDSGIMKGHEDLKNLLVPGYNSVDKKTEAEGGIIEDTNGHGTHVSGCGSAQANNAKGVAGVGWNFKIMHVKCSNMPSGAAFGSDIMDGARWAAEHGAKTVSASFAGVDSPSVGTTGTYIRSIGSVFFYAAGNDGRDLTGFRHEDTIVVGASNEADTRAIFSAFGRGCTLFAPGEGIMSTVIGGGYDFASGTSMATPVANGALALMWSVNPQLNGDEAKDILFTTCDSIGPSSIFGFGRINSLKGVQKALATLAKDVDVSSVAVASGNYAAGNLVSVRDTSLTNSFNVSSVNQQGVGAVASAVMDVNIPLSQGRVNSFAFNAKLTSNGNKPTSVIAYMYNQLTGKYDQISSRGVYGGNIVDLNVRLGNTDVSKYMSPSGQFRFILRSVIPARLGPSSNTLVIGHVKGRYTTSPFL